MTFRHRLLIGAAAGAIMLASAVSGPANALDPADVPANWSGFHMGVHVGGGWADIDPFRGKSGIPFSGSGDIDGVIAGGSIGYDWQFGRFVVGVDGRISGAGLDGTLDQVSLPATGDIDWISSLTGRAGVSFGQTLLYGRGGIAWVNEQYCVLGTCDPDHTRAGWLAGAGVEYRFMHNWSVALEYNHMDFGTDNVHGTEVGLDVDVVTFGVNYRFGGPLIPR